MFAFCDLMILSDSLSYGKLGFQPIIFVVRKKKLLLISIYNEVLLFILNCFNKKLTYVLFFSPIDFKPKSM